MAEGEMGDELGEAISRVVETRAATGKNLDAMHAELKAEGMANHNTIRFNNGNYVQDRDSGSPVFKQTNARSSNVYRYGNLATQLSGGQYGNYHQQDCDNRLNLQ